MPANIDPIYSKIADVQWIGSVLTANTTKDLTSGTSYLIFTSDATNGGYVSSITAKSAGTNALSVLRIWINNGSTTGTAANNAMIAEVTLPAITNSETAAQVDIQVPINKALPAGYKLYATVGTGMTLGWMLTAWGGKY